MTARRLAVLGTSTLLLAGFAQAGQKWGLGPIGNKDSKFAWETSRLAVAHGANANYDGRFTYARIAYTATSNSFFGGGRGGGGRRGDPMWDHDYPNSDRNFPTILAAISNLRARSDGSVIVRADDPDLFRFPFAYLCEVGSWNPTESEVLALRKYLLKGGFVIVDDFRGQASLDNFSEQMRRIIPDSAPVRIDVKHPIFDAFYRIKSLDALQSYGGQPPSWYGMFENNDPTQRMMMIVNHNYDVSEYWEYSATGRYAVDQTNEAYKLGVNYVFYTLTR